MEALKAVFVNVLLESFIFIYSLSLQPFEHPYSTSDGVIFDLMSIVPFIKKYKANPITGEVGQIKDGDISKNTDIWYLITC